MKRDSNGRFIKGSNGDLFEGFGKWYDKFGYPSIWLNGKNVMVHVYVWERANGKRPKGFHIHHIDGNKGNYDLSNLELLSPHDHQKVHAGWRKDAEGNWSEKKCKHCKKYLKLELFYPRKGHTPLNICKQCCGIINKERLLMDKEFREKKRLYLKEYYKKNKEELTKCKTKK